MKRKNDPEVLKHYSTGVIPSNLVSVLGFDKTLHVASDMLNNEEWDDSLHEYAISLLEEVKQQFPQKWDSSWKYDALLGVGYHIILKYDERFAAYKRAMNKVQPAPPELLVALARCCFAPGKPPITEEEAISFIKEAIKTTPYIEGIELLRGIYKSLGNAKELTHWEKILENLKGNGPHLKRIEDIIYEEDV